MMTNTMTHTFPQIVQLSDLVPHIQDAPEIGVYPNEENGTTVACYAISSKDTFMGDNAAFRRECRGITFGSDGQILARTMHKFFNIGENAETQPEMIPWTDVARVLVKEDGSMITPLIVDGGLICKTKRSFTAKEAVAATKWLKQHPRARAWVIAQIESGWTPTFEWVSPESPIVLTHYKVPRLILLQLRHMTSGVYKVADFEDAEFRANCPFEIAANVIDQFYDSDGVVSFAKLREAAKNLTAEEGWVVQAHDGRMWKMKTDWYFDVHHSMTFMRWRDALVAARDDRLDDLRAAYTVGGRDTGLFDFVERWVTAEVESRMMEVHALDNFVSIDFDAEMPIADIVKKYRNEPYFSEVMRMHRGVHEYTIRAGVRRNMFRDTIPLWSLGVVPAELLEKWDISDAAATVRVFHPSNL